MATATGRKASPSRRSRNNKYPNLGSQLNQLVASVEEGQLSAKQAAADSPIHSSDSVAVTIHLSGNVDDVVQFLEDNGGAPRNIGEDYIEAYVPFNLLGQPSEQPGVTRVREIVPPEPSYGEYVSQGVQTHLSQEWNDAGYSGQGVKVGIIDGGFEGFSDLVVGGELTAVVGVRCYSDIGEYSENPADCEINGVHGTAVAETIIDIAPQVTLYIAGPVSQGDVNDIVDWMVSEGVSVINMSLSWGFTGPGDGTSPYSWSVLNAVDHAVEGGITWANSAGNRTRQAWFNSGPFSDADGDGLIEFDGSDESNGFELEEEESALIQLRWEGNWGGASRNLDFYIVEQATGQRLLEVRDPQSGGPGDIPLEIEGFVAPRDGVYEVFVEHVSGSVPAWIQLMVWSVRLEHSTANVSITSPGESANPGLLTVGASPWWNPHNVAPYSSRGPTPDGRVKPDIVGLTAPK